jgi:hypothetical protein
VLINHKSGKATLRLRNMAGTTMPKRSKEKNVVHGKLLGHHELDPQRTAPLPVFLQRYITHITRTEHKLSQTQGHFSKCLLQCQGHERQGKAEELFQMEGN